MKIIPALAIAGASITAALGMTAIAQAQSHAGHNAALHAAIESTGRSEANRARDIYRHPYETLEFIGVKPSDTVVELWPGGGWYTEILATYLASGGGKLILASPAWGRSGIDKLKGRQIPPL